MWFLLIFFLVFSVLIIAHEAGHYWAARRCGVVVEEFGVGFGKKIFSKKYKGTLFSWNLIPLGGFVRLRGETNQKKIKGSLAACSWRGKVLITVAGVIVNYALAVVLLSALYMIGTKPLLINQADVKQAIAEGFIELGAENEAGRQPLVFVKEVKLPLWEAAPKAIHDTGRISWHMIQKVGEIPMMLWKNHQLPDGLMGPVGMAHTAQMVFPQGLETIIRFMALLSLSLAIMNILPIPALDGGRLFFLLIEGLLRKPIPLRFEFAFQLLGFALLIGLMLIATWQDIIRWIQS